MATIAWYALHCHVFPGGMSAGRGGEGPSLNRKQSDIPETMMAVQTTKLSGTQLARLLLLSPPVLSAVMPALLQLYILHPPTFSSPVSLFVDGPRPASIRSARKCVLALTPNNPLRQLSVSSRVVYISQRRTRAAPSNFYVLGADPISSRNVASLGGGTL